MCVMSKIIIFYISLSIINTNKNTWVESKHHLEFFFLLFASSLFFCFILDIFLFNNYKNKYFSLQLKLKKITIQCPYLLLCAIFLKNVINLLLQLKK